jgi:exodeoxyribonuclease VII large subunit
MQPTVFSPSDFVAVLNQTLEYAYPSVTIVGELSNFKVSRGKWVYFDLKDDKSSVKFFGTIYNLPGPLEDGMMVRVVGQPRLSEKYGFSVNVRSITPEGEGSLKKAQDLLALKLEKEGLFKQERKRQIAFPPNTIALVASKESAGYDDFVKVINARWSGIKIHHYEVQVQGEAAVRDIQIAFEAINQSGRDLDAVVLLRGGGSADDLAAFSSEQVTRAVSASRIPTLVAVGHERDVSLAELAADVRASTPSNAAEIIVPDKKAELKRLSSTASQLSLLLKTYLTNMDNELNVLQLALDGAISDAVEHFRSKLESQTKLMNALNPNLVLSRGYSIVRDQNGKVIKTAKQLKIGQSIMVKFNVGGVSAVIKDVE